MIDLLTEMWYKKFGGAYMWVVDVGRGCRAWMSGSVNQHDLPGRPALIAGIQPHHGPCITTYTLSQKEFIRTQIIIFWEKKNIQCIWHVVLMSYLKIDQ